MPYHLRPAKRSEAKPLIGIYSESGCGKTWSSLMLARGFVGPTGRIAMIETESGRGEVYADQLPGGYDVISMRETFSPQNYGEAITAVEKATPMPDALIIDSASHEWEGSGGVLSMAAANEADGKKSMMIWQGPKLEHQRYFVLRLLATPIPLVIVCMRAKYPMKESVSKAGTKEWVRAEVVEPVQSDGILFELMIHGWIDREHRFQGTKYTRDDLKPVIPTGQPITLETGARLAAWTRGQGPSLPGTQASATSSTKASSAGASPAGPSPAGTSPAVGTPDYSQPGVDLTDARAVLKRDITHALQTYGLAGQSDVEKKKRQDLLEKAFGTRDWRAVEALPLERLQGGLAIIEVEYGPKPGEAENLERVSELQGRISRAIQASGLKASKIVQIAEKEIGTADYHNAEPPALEKLAVALEKLAGPEQTTL
jgi:hypothetical protein